MTDLQKQVTRFRDKAHQAEAQLKEAEAVINGYDAALRRAFAERDQLQREMTKARMMAMALAASSEESVHVPFAVLEAIDKGEIIGIEPARQEDGSLIVAPVYAPQEDEYDELEADTSQNAETSQDGEVSQDSEVQDSEPETEETGDVTAGYLSAREAPPEVLQ